LNVTAPGAISQHRVAGQAVAVNASVGGVYYTTIIRETPMNNRSAKCMATLRGKTRVFGPTGPASALLSVNTIPLQNYGTASKRFHATAPMASSKNDIDILNTMSARQDYPDGMRGLHRIINVAPHR